MFDRNDKKKNQVVRSNDTTTTVIGQGVFIDGQSFKGVGAVRIEGVYKGDMHIDGSVTVGQTGEVKGNITANIIVIAGTVTGNIMCREELHITDTAVMEGDIQTNQILVDLGAIVNGTISTGVKGLAGPVNLDDTVKTIQPAIKSIEQISENKKLFNKGEDNNSASK